MLKSLRLKSEAFIQGSRNYYPINFLPLKPVFATSKLQVCLGSSRETNLQLGTISLNNKYQQSRISESGISSRLNAISKKQVKVMKVSEERDKMNQQAKSTPAFLSIKLIPMLLLIQWVGLVAGISALNATKSWAVVKTSSSSSAGVSALAAPPVATVETSKSATTVPNDTVVSKESTETSTSREELVDSLAAASTKAKDLLATGSSKSALPLATQNSTGSLLTTPESTRTKIIAQATQTTASPAAATSNSSNSTSSDLTTQPDVAPSSSTATSASTNKPATTRKSSANYSNTYIDSTDYSVGATQPKRQRTSDRPSIIFSERSTGCQAVLSAGQGVAGGLCESGPERVSKGAIAKSNLTSGSSAMSSRSLKLEALPRSGITATSRNVTRSVLPRYAAGSPLNRVLARSGSPGSVYGSFGSSFSNYSSIKVPKWFVPSNTRIVFPLAIPTAITSAFGWRLHPISGTWRFHSGTDLGAPMGTPVLAAFAGKVAIANFLGGYGLAVVLDHNKGTQESLYGHLSEITVEPGAQVKQGDVIGLVGSTGNSTGPHLHFEVRQSTPQGWVAVDPGQQLETALAQLVRALQTAQTSSPRSGT